MSSVSGRHLVASCVALLLLCGAAAAHAIPAFARRYETSCQTCHVAFPRLTPFGEAFRRNGYRFPGGGDATAEKEEPLGLGNEALKEQWPKAVWPGQMPRNLPLSLIVDGKASLGEHPEPHMYALHAHGGAAMPGMVMPGDNGTDTGKLGLATLGGHVGMRAGGTLGDVASFFASVDVGGHEPISVERGWVDLQPLGPTALHVRVGRFEPTLHGVSLHRSLFNHQLRLMTTTVEQNPFAPEPNATGIELSGTALGRLGWALGAVDNARGEEDADLRWLRKDFYGRGEWKFGGMRLDGLDAQAGTAAWRERSILVGVSGWSGRANIASGPFVDDFLRAGADLHVIFDDLLLDVVAVREQHDQPAEAGQKATVDMGLCELTWMATAALFPTARFEGSRIERGDFKANRWLGSLQITAVLRPNLLLRVAGEMGADELDHGTNFRDVVLSFATAF